LLSDVRIYLLGLRSLSKRFLTCLAKAPVASEQRCRAADKKQRYGAHAHRSFHFAVLHYAEVNVNVT
jgi:hypothetical protein